MKIQCNNQALKGILWFILSLFISSANDVVTKYLGSNIPAYEVVFLRFVFGTLTLLPFMLRDLNSFKTSRIQIHIIRGALLFGGILFWCLGLNAVKVTMATVINFTIPIFVLILAVIFLKETLNMFRIIATAIGFIGIVVVINPTSLEFNYISILLIVGSFMFASLDILNKKFVNNESMLSMLFYSSFFTMLFSLIPAMKIWITPSFQDLVLFLILGAGANLILYCLLKAFALVDASAVAPYRYIELIFSAGLGYIVFKEIPNHSTLVGAVVIIFATLFLAYELFIKHVSNKKLKQQNLTKELAD
jgi:S-adenosylmethionine uptake transporter